MSPGPDGGTLQYRWDDPMNDATQGTAPPPVTAPEGEFVSVDAGAVDAQDLLVLARIAGLPIGEDRAAGLSRELLNTRAVVAELDRLLRDRPTLALGAFAPYDPAWPAPPTARNESADTPSAGR